MTVREAMLVSVEEYVYRVKGYRMRERSEYERTRWALFELMYQLPYVKNKPSTPEQYCRFAWEVEQKKPAHISKVTEEENAALIQMFNNFIGRKPRS